MVLTDPLPAQLRHPNLGSDEDQVPGMNISFAGCGFLGIYHVGVSACLRKYAPELLVERIAGASAGALAAACLLCNADLGVITSSVLKTATEARSRALGPFSPTFNVEKLLREGLLGVLPENAHEIVSGRLFVSVTRLSDGKNILLSQFDTREDLIQALLCSSFIPGFSGIQPLKIKGVRYIDGGFTDNLPELDSSTITVSPFCGEADVCPKDSTPGLITISLANTSIEISRENMQRFARILFPPSPETLNKMCQQGFNDALDFLQRNNLISCTRCIAVQSTVPLEADNDQRSNNMEAPVSDKYGQFGDIAERLGDLEYEEWEESCQNCDDCKSQRKEAMLDKLPDTVNKILQEAIDAANDEVEKWNNYSYASLLTLPMVYSVKIPYKMATGILSTLPTVQGVRSFSWQLMELFRTILLSRRNTVVSEDVSATHHHHQHRQKDPLFSCNVAVTEFMGSNERYYATDYEDTLTDVENGYTSESEALNHLAVRYAQRSSRSLAPSRNVSRGPSRIQSRVQSRLTSRVQSRVPSRNPSRALSRRNSECSNDSDIADQFKYPTNVVMEDAFDRILNVTDEQEALMAYYYLDDNNRMQVTEIFDMSVAMASPVVKPRINSISESYCGDEMPYGKKGILRNSYHGEDSHQDYIEKQLSSYKDADASTNSKEALIAVSSSPQQSEPESDQYMSSHPGYQQ